MIRITEVTLCNFISVGQHPQSIDLAADGLTLVLGRNGDASGANARNGVGKTTLAQAISYGLYGEPLSKVRIDNLINNINGRGMRVTIAFERDGIAYRIERGRKPEMLRFIVEGGIAPAGRKPGGETNEAQGGNKYTQIEINRVLGMSHTLFKHLVLLNTHTLPFLRAEAAEQRKVIEELFGITQLSLRDEALKQRSLLTKEVIRDAEARLKAGAEANARISVAIDQAARQRLDWQRAHAATLARLETQIAALTKVDFATEIAVFDAIERWAADAHALQATQADCVAGSEILRREAAGLDAEIIRQRHTTTTTGATRLARLEADLLACEDAARQSPQAQIARLEADVKRRRQAAASARRQAGAAQAEQAATQAAMQDADHQRCVTCGQGLTGTTHLAAVLASLQATATALGVTASEHDAVAASLDQEALDGLGEIAEVNRRHRTAQADHQSRAGALRDEIIEARREQAEQNAERDATIATLEATRGQIAATLDQRAIDLQAIDAALAAHGPRPHSSYRRREEVWALREAAAALAAEQAREAARINPHEGTITSLRAALQPLNDSVLRAAQISLKHEDFLHRLLSGKESFVRKRLIDQNLSHLNQSMHQHLQALGLPHAVRFQPDLSVEISLFGCDYDFEQLSRGEMNRVILATSWSFRDVWESLNTALNLLLVDEFADNGLDEAGAEAVVAIMQRMACQQGRSVFLISHKEALISRVGRILLVHKDSQFTTFEPDGAG